MPSPHPFVLAAEAFIAIVESADKRARIEFVRDLERALVDLYAAGLMLSDVEPTDNSTADALTNDEAAALQRLLGKKMGHLDLYSVAYDPYEVDSTPGTGSIADDVADIYRDLQNGFAALRNGETSNAFWEWKFGFDTHWGRHAVKAIYALYSLRSRLVE